MVVGEGVGGRIKRARIKDVLPVPPDSTATRDPPGQGSIGDARIRRQKQAATEDVKLRVANILAMPRTVEELRARLSPEDMALLTAQKLTPLNKFLELWPEAFELRSGKWQDIQGAASASAPRQTTLR
jgi:hypothetical protein